MPALATDVVCCSIASWILALHGGGMPHEETVLPTTTVSQFWYETMLVSTAAMIETNSISWQAVINPATHTNTCKCTSQNSPWPACPSLECRQTRLSGTPRHLPAPALLPPASTLQSPACGRENAQLKGTWKQGRKRAGSGTTSWGESRHLALCAHNPRRVQIVAFELRKHSTRRTALHAHTCTAEAVRPALVVARPLVMTAREASLKTYLRMCRQQCI